MSSAARRRVAITGASGVVGRVLLDHLADRYQLVPLTRTLPLPGGWVVQLSDVAGLARAFAGATGVVHLAAVADVGAGWRDVLETNIDGTFNVFEAARQAGVPRVVFASTNHVVGRFEEDAGASLYDLSDHRRLDASAPFAPDSPYGVSKAAGELLAGYFTAEYGLSIISVRLGTVLAVDDPTDPRAVAGPSLLPLQVNERQRRLRATWLSHRDCAALISGAIETPVTSAVVTGTSNNPRRIWDFEEARRLLAYAPLDSAPSGLGEGSRHG